MNMFLKFFGVESRTKVVEVDGGKFEFKHLSKDTLIRVLWFTKYDIAQSTVADDRVARIAPFQKNGVACEKRLPGGRNIELFFYEYGDLWCENGFILADEHLVYMYRDQMRLLTKYHDDVVILDKKALRNLGYDGNIHFDEEMFYFRSSKSELVPFDYFDYKGNLLTTYKKERIAREIMLQVRMFITKEFAKNHLDVKRDQELSALTWDAKTATIENVKLLLTLEKEENNLEDINANKIYSIIECFEARNLQDRFTRYMELFFTAYEQISLHEDWTKSQWFGRNNLIKELDDHHNAVYQKMHTSMDLLTQEYSFGNGFAMRVSPCGIMAVELEEALSLAKVSAEVTHNHPEGIKGAQAVAGAIFLAKTKKSKEEIKAFVEDNYYSLNFTLDNIREKYRFDVTCQGSVPQAIVAFLESETFEDAIRNAVSIGGDSDTIAAITGSIAWAYYVEEGIFTPMNYPNCLEPVREMLPDNFKKTIDKFWAESVSRFDSYQRPGFCTGIPHNT